MTEREHAEGAFEALSEGIGRRALLKASAAIGASAIAPAYLLSPGIEDAFAVVAEGEGPTVLQRGRGRRVGSYIALDPENVSWGYLPNRDATPIRRVASGSLVTIDTISHEGILEDQGRDPDRFFGAHGVREQDVLADTREIAASDIPHDFAADGPHIVSGPVEVIGTQPGDVLRIDVVGLVPRVPYGVISNRHGRGALPNEYPEGPKPDPAASPQRPELYRNVSIFTPVRRIDGRDRGVLAGGRKHRLEFPIDPFMGIMGVAQDTSARVNSIPPTDAGGNLDIRDLTVGSTLYLPVFVPGAKFFVGDPHYRQGDGEVALTAWEAPLRGTFRLTRIAKGSTDIPGNRGLPDNRQSLTGPFAETADYWIPVGLHPDLDEATRRAVREAIGFLSGEFGMSRAVAYAYMSAATDFVISQVVDRTKGVHARIRKSEIVER